MLQEINSSLRPVIEDFDRYWGWQHRKARLEVELRDVEAEIAYWQSSHLAQPQPWWKWLRKVGWLGQWLIAISDEVHRLLDAPPDRLSHLEFLYRTRSMLRQQIDLLTRQMSQSGDPSDVYHELIDLKKEVLLSDAHPHGREIRRIHLELHAQERHLALLDESLQAVQTANRSLETLIQTAEKARDTDLIFNQRYLFPELRRPHLYRLRRGLQFTHTSLISLCELIRQDPDYHIFPEDLKAGHFESFQRHFRRYMAQEGLIIRNWRAILQHCWQTTERLASLQAWIQRSTEAIEQRHSFLLRKQERLIREAE